MTSFWSICVCFFPQKPIFEGRQKDDLFIPGSCSNMCLDAGFELTNWSCSLNTPLVNMRFNRAKWCVYSQSPKPFPSLNQQDTSCPLALLTKGCPHLKLRSPGLEGQKVWGTMYGKKRTMKVGPCRLCLIGHILKALGILNINLYLHRCGSC